MKMFCNNCKETYDTAEIFGSFMYYLMMLYQLQ